MDKICSDIRILVRLLFRGWQGLFFVVLTTRTVLDKVHGDLGQRQGHLGLLHLSLGGCRASRVHPEAHTGCRGCRTSPLLEGTKQHRGTEPVGGRQVWPHRYEKPPQFC